ncbi:MAG: SDR family oxidoreductase [Bacteroidota bacterium]
MFRANLFQGQVVLVTGGGSGIGYAIARRFLELGARVFIASRKEERLQNAVGELSAHGECAYFVCDIRNNDAIRALAEGIRQQAGRLDVLVNNAGGQFPIAAEHLTENGWNTVINNNLNGTWHVTQTLAKAFFIPQQSGNIVNIIANIYRGFPGMVHTGAARGGVDNFTKTLAVEWSKYQIRLNAVAPGIIKSSGLKQYPPELMEGLTEKIPLRRLGEVDEVAWLVLFLASPMAGFLTGETIYLDGGQRLWGDVFTFF